MIEFFKTLPMHFKRAWNSVRRNFAETLSSVFAVTVTSILIAIFVIVGFNIGGFTQNVEDSVRVVAQIDLSVEGDKIKELQKEIENLPHVTSVIYSDKEEQLEKLIDNPQGGEGYVDFRDDNPLSAVFYVEPTSGDYLNQIETRVSQIDGIDKVFFGGESVAQMVSAFNSARLGGGIFIGALCLLAIFLISNTIKINIQNRKEEIAIMRNVGASNLFIKMPFLIEGVIIGAIGAIIPILVSIFGYGFLYDSMNGQFFTILFKMYAPMPFIYLVSLFLLAVGMIVGLIGSFVSVTRYLRWKR
ncbi:cell division transport system permease protein [Breznakia sp. PF5-3]|uniref:permease-like cell division protein FtsX n=1 Tax=unclassified Breznakia TaxID=2623764 RepID=UPI002405D3F4|nr:MULTISPECIES: permease-like cell division protein FtsX [unclassified Breznakia]MDF9824566.1 cell division transport system permease protein [Breznakia sp. PM6-1]MDF9835456.1 cell division transport system permease protein [Breznakia sp. PF5-3]MDF9837866.1 cell division transport system permease protein [Breznakia sp. PFB2-8]MDF9859841.1 cell division transport system permease protein [Breznakia sp. PH5-24]